VFVISIYSKIKLVASNHTGFILTGFGDIEYLTTYCTT